MKIQRTLSLVLILLLVAVFSAAALADVQQDTAAEVEKIKATVEEEAAKNRPVVRTMPNGVKIQRTPATDDCLTPGFFTYFNYNNKFNNADDRGCYACHTDLGKLVTDMKSYPHLQLENSMGIEISVQQCIICHRYSTGVQEATGFGNLMHSLHDAKKNPAFDALGGDCMSCHYVSDDGKGFQLWDDVKYSVLRGITTVGAENVNGSFYFDQNTVLDNEDLFHVNWFFRQGGIDRYAANHAGLVPDPANDGVYDMWEITVEGEVENPFTMTISEMIEQFGLDTTTMTIACGDNTIGMPWVGNFEVSGIDVNKLIDYAGIANDTANVIFAADDCGTEYVYTLKEAGELGAMLVLTVGGEPLPYQSGYPVQVWFGGAAAWSDTKEVHRLTVSTVDTSDPSFPAWAFNTGFVDENGVSYYKPGIGMMNLSDGQIFEAGKPVHLEGYGHAWELAIRGIELSFDKGNTWVSFETPDTTAKNWVYWTYDWEAPSTGSYVVMARSVAEDGTRTYAPVQYLINVQ